MRMIDSFLTVADVAKRLTIGDEQVLGFIKTGKLRASNVGLAQNDRDGASTRQTLRRFSPHAVTVSRHRAFAETGEKNYPVSSNFFDQRKYVREVTRQGELPRLIEPTAKQPSGKLGNGRRTMFYDSQNTRPKQPD